MLFTGVLQVFHAERVQTEAITTDFRNFVKAEIAKKGSGLSSAKEALEKFVRLEDAPNKGALLGFSDGKLSVNKASQGSTIHQDAQLLTKLASYSDENKAQMFIVRTDTSTYVSGIVPISAAGTDDAMLAIISDYSTDITPHLHPANAVCRNFFPSVGIGRAGKCSRFPITTCPHLQTAGNDGLDYQRTGFI